MVTLLLLVLELPVLRLLPIRMEEPQVKGCLLATPAKRFFAH
jgi:hypothetical protein